MSVKIKKANIKKGMFLDVEYVEHIGDGVNNVVKLSSDNVVHDDLREAFSLLDKELATYAEQYEAGKNQLADIKVTGFTIGGNGDTEGVTLTGTRKLSSGKGLNINSPFLQFEETGIENIIEKCIEEVQAYIFEGKHQPSDQYAFEFDEIQE